MKRLLQCLLLAAWLIAVPSWADTLRGVVIVVIDGDTVLFKPDYYAARSRAFLKLRLADIDAPEKDQSGGDAATRALSAMVLKQLVEIRTVGADAYGRTIAQLQLGALQVNMEMVRLGQAWVATRARDNIALEAALGEARHAKRGIWAEAEPTPPWVWRRGKRASAY